MALRKMGVLEKYDVEMIGANAEAIDKAEDRQLFNDAMIAHRSRRCRARIRCKTWPKRWPRVADIGLPAIIRPSFTLGGTGGGIAYNAEEFESRSSNAASTLHRPTRF